MRINGILIMVALLSTSAASAQMPGPGGPGRGAGPRAGFGGHGRKLVTGEPYSADVTNTVTKTLPDSNVIQHVTTGHVARDSEGRTYSQETVTGGMLGQKGPKTFTFISDPVAGYSYVLNADTKTAIRRAIHTPEANSNWTPGTHEGKTRPANPNVVVTDLGTQIINGVSATGKRTTHTIPAGQMGNTLPIVSTSESWFSPDLKVMVSSKHTDPREGDSVYALTNISRSEPSASLFTVPSDYTIKDAPTGHGTRN
jgi:predicted secreted protein